MGSYANSKYTPKDQCYAITNDTAFHTKTFFELKAMVAGANPDAVKGVGAKWLELQKDLAGPGGIRTMLDKAVAAVLEHWEGDAAEAFEKHAKEISRQIENGAAFAERAGHGMQRSGEALAEYKKNLDTMEMPSDLASAGDWISDLGRRDDTAANDQLKNGKSASQVVADNEGELSAGKEQQLKAAATMEYLGAAYRTNAAAMGTLNRGIDEQWKGDGPGPAPSVPPVIPLPTSVARPKPTPRASLKPTERGSGFSPGMQSPRPDGVHGGVGEVKPGAKAPQMPSVGTDLDSFTPNPGVSGGGSPNTATPNGGLGPINGGPSTGPTSGGNALLPGISGVRSGAGRGTGANRGTPAGTTIGRGPVGGPGGTANAQTGRPGMPGGMGGTSGTGGRAGIAGRGALARTPGGVVGATGGKPSGSAQGGSGLHRSRGGTQAGESVGNRRPNSMMGMPGSHGANSEEKNEGGKRPDYLVEDEETWTPERHVAPKVID